MCSLNAMELAKVNEAVAVAGCSYAEVGNVKFTALYLLPVACMQAATFYPVL